MVEHGRVAEGGLGWGGGCEGGEGLVFEEKHLLSLEGELERWGEEKGLSKVSVL